LLFVLAIKGTPIRNTGVAGLPLKNFPSFLPAWNILSVVKNLSSNACACFTHADDVRLSVLSAVRVQTLDCLDC
jgi:hypothetical protein